MPDKLDDFIEHNTQMKTPGKGAWEIQKKIMSSRNNKRINVSYIRVIKNIF